MDLPQNLMAKRVLLVISGGIAAYKALELIRLLRQSGASVRAILTKGGAEFVTALSVGALTEDKVYTDLFSLTDEAEMGHIRLSREADLIVVAPASADLLARMAMGQADDLASTVLLASDKPILVAPAMNVRMWEHPATRANLATLSQRGVHLVGPKPGPMACGEFGMGRLSEPPQILAAISNLLSATKGRLGGRRAIVTSGPTHEAIDPVRFISNRSSGKQGHAIAAALARLGADTTLVTGPTSLPAPDGVAVIRIESAADMLAACQAALPADVAVCAAAVSDWRPEAAATSKMKKGSSGVPTLTLTETPDILASLSHAGNRRPKLVVGFALETEELLANGKAKLDSKGCDWIVANSVSQDLSSVFGADENSVAIITHAGIDRWPLLSKQEVGRRLAVAIADQLEGTVTQ